jgi:hypothetical protein
LVFGSPVFGEGEPGFHVLLKAFLRFQSFDDRDDGSVGKSPPQQRGEEWVGG